MLLIRDNRSYLGIPKRFWKVGLATIFISLAVGIAISVIQLRAQNTQIVPKNSQAIETDVIRPVAEIKRPGLPVRLKIPKINVDAAVEGLGLTPEGDLDAPDGPDNSGWYNAGPRPGEIGSSVLDGHFGWKGNKPAVFDKLHTLRVGDEIFVEDENKVTHTFIVTELRSFQPEDDARSVFLSSDNKSHLNLITCQGVWNKNQASYSTRLVVFADILEG